MNASDAMKRAIVAVGSQARLGEIVGRSQNWVSKVAGGKITEVPARIAFAIETATGGAVSARELAGLAPAAAEAPASPAAESPAPASPAEERAA